MNTGSNLSGTASLFLALGDKTRLRLLNLLRDREVCVSSFTTVLGQSQPKVSRHLAYLRNAGLVEVRRDGKWMHYRISDHLDANRQKLLYELFRWMEDQEALVRDREKYEREFGPKPETSANEQLKVGTRSRSHRRQKASAARSEPVVRDDLGSDSPEPSTEAAYDPVPVSHNELEDFLL